MVLSKISIAMPVPATPTPASAVRVTLCSAWVALALAERLSFWMAATGLSEVIGTLGATVGLSAGVPLVIVWLSLQAAGVAATGLFGSMGHAVRPSGVDAMPGARSLALLVAQAAASPDAGHG